MTPEILAWIAKAEDDWRVMLLESRVTEDTSFNSICFHAQQCIEKYFKGRLLVAGIISPKTHDLIRLLDSLIEIEPAWELLRYGCSKVNAYAVAIRYPGVDANREQANFTVEHCRHVRRLARTSLQLLD